MNIYELYGQLAEREEQLRMALEAESKAHLETLGLLRRLKSGDVKLENVMLDENQWRIVSRGDT